MNAITFRIVTAAALLLAAAGAAHADSSYDQYRRVVLGDTSAPAAAAKAAPTGLTQVPGAYAQYLIENGMNADQAVAAARRIGETPDYRWAAATPSRQPLNAAAAHEKFLGKTDYAVSPTTTSSAE